jgi:hypothetical protein
MNAYAHARKVLTEASPARWEKIEPNSQSISDAVWLRLKRTAIAVATLVRMNV